MSNEKRSQQNATINTSKMFMYLDFIFTAMSLKYVNLNFTTYSQNEQNYRFYI